MTFKSGFVSIIGRPNVGKSTLLNHVMGQKIAIMSDKAQTTRNKIQGIYTTETEQIVFIDTPGIHKPHNALGDYMVESAYSTLREVDTVLFMVPADETRGKGDNMIIERLMDFMNPTKEFRDYLISQGAALVGIGDLTAVPSSDYPVGIGEDPYGIRL